MANAQTAQIYLATPTNLELDIFAANLGRVLDGFAVACLRVSVNGIAENMIGRTLDQLREISHSRDVAIVIDDHYRLAEKHGLDGVHLTTGAQHIRDIRKNIGTDAIIGAFCGASRHSGMTAGEIGADYVSFGPLSDRFGIGDGSIAPQELFRWWSEMIEVPVVAQGNITSETLAAVAPFADFVTFGDEIWTVENPLIALTDFAKILNA